MTEITVPKDVKNYLLQIPVIELKKMIQNIMDIEIDSQKLIYKGKQLTNNQKLSDHGKINLIQSP